MPIIGLIVIVEKFINQQRNLMWSYLYTCLFMDLMDIITGIQERDMMEARKLFRMNLKRETKQSIVLICWIRYQFMLYYNYSLWYKTWNYLYLPVWLDLMKTIIITRILERKLRLDGGNSLTPRLYWNTALRKLACMDLIDLRNSYISMLLCAK